MKLSLWLAASLIAAMILVACAPVAPAGTHWEAIPNQPGQPGLAPQGANDVPPAGDAAAAAAPAEPSGPLGMKYQFDAGCAATPNPMDYPACILQRVQSAELTGEQAVVMIQELGARLGAPSFEDALLVLPNMQPAVVWCPAGASFPPDTARPLEGTKGAQWASNLVIVMAGTGGPEREITAIADKCWMVYVH